MFDFEKYAFDNNIRLVTGVKQNTPGWITVACPFCPEGEKHLGYNKSSGHFNCWKCGWHPAVDVIMKLSSISFREAKSVMEQYDSVVRSEPRKIERMKQSCSLPSGLHRMEERHRKYLAKRGFRPGALEKDWGLMATDILGPYKHRIFIPVYYRGRIVTFQTRDVTGKSERRYLACNEREEEISIKDVLYGYDEASRLAFPFVVLVEGVPSVWKLGPGRAVASFGMEVSSKQTSLLSKFKRVAVALDRGATERKRALKLAYRLDSLGVETVVADFPEGKKDPSELSSSQVKRWLEEVGQTFEETKTEVNP